jgi:hypothetical protein
MKVARLLLTLAAPSLSAPTHSVTIGGVTAGQACGGYSMWKRRRRTSLPKQPLSKTLATDILPATAVSSPSIERRRRMKIDLQTFAAAVAGFLFLVAQASAYDYQYEFWNVYSSNALDHVVEQTNIKRSLEGTDPNYGCSYWNPILSGQQARLSLKFEFERPTKDVYLHATMFTAFNGGFGSLLGSKNGIDWTQLMDAPSSSDAGYTYSSLLPESLLGSSEIWIQGRLQTTSGNILAQFLRWDTRYASNQPPYNVFELKANLVPVPEPSTYAIALAGLACGGWHLRRRRRA